MKRKCKCQSRKKLKIQCKKSWPIHFIKTRHNKGKTLILKHKKKLALNRFCGCDSCVMIGIYLTESKASVSPHPKKSLTMMWCVVFTFLKTWKKLDEDNYSASSIIVWRKYLRFLALKQLSCNISGSKLLMLRQYCDISLKD